MMASMTAFTVNDAFMKMLAGTLPLFQALTLRGVGVVLALLLLCAAFNQLRFNGTRRDWRLIGWRAVAEATAAVCFLTALFNMPLAELSAILQALPLTVSLAGVVFLGETLGWQRMSAIAIGFIGVMLIIQPGGANFNTFSLLGLAAVAAVTARDLAARQLSKDAPTLFVALVTSTFVTIVSAILSLFVDWQPVSLGSAGFLAASSLTIIGGYVFSISAMRVGEIAAVAPFRYTSLVVALILGVLIFKERPDFLSLIGAAIVVATGLFMLFRENRKKGA